MNENSSCFYLLFPFLYSRSKPCIGTFSILKLSPIFFSTASFVYLQMTNSSMNSSSYNDTRYKHFTPCNIILQWRITFPYSKLWKLEFFVLFGNLNKNYLAMLSFISPDLLGRFCFVIEVTKKKPENKMELFQARWAWTWCMVCL